MRRAAVRRVFLRGCVDCQNGGGVVRKLFEFCGSPEMLIALLYSDDVCQTIKDEVRASRKVSLFMFAEEEPYYTPDSDDIQITMTGEDIRPKVDLGEPVQVGEFGCEPDLFGKPLTNFEWSLDQKTWHHSGKRMPDVLGNIYVRHFSSEPVQIVDDLRFCDIVDRDQLNVEFDGADEMMGQKAGDDCLAQGMPAHELMENDGWIPFVGETCPVNRDVIVDIKFGDGGVFCGRRADSWRWFNLDLDHKESMTIVAYRIAENTEDRGDPEITCA